MVEFDVTSGIVIVGAGGAGMAAALRSARLGSEVLLLEKSVRRGCNSELSGGLVQAAGTRFQRELGIEDTPEQMMEDILAKNGGDCDRDVLRAICVRSSDVVHFLADHVGLDLHLDTNVLHFGHSVLRMHATPSELGSEIVAGLRAAVAAEPGITFVDEVEVAGLLRDGDRVVGVDVVRPERERAGAHSVLLSCDGFGANRSMVARHCPEIAGAVFIGSENNTGDGIRLGAEAGAELDHMNSYQGHCHVNPRHGTRLGGGLPALGAIMVNLEGRRFEREDQGYSEFARVVLAQPEQVAVEIFDQRIFDLAWPTGAFREAHEAGAIESAATVGELAGTFSLPADVLEHEIADYSRAVADGVDRLGRIHFDAPLMAPFYGSLVTGALAHTQGGLRIDSRCRVLGPNGSAIAGLYAAGGTAAGISGAGPAGYMSGNGLIHALATGFIAAEHMAA